MGMLTDTLDALSYPQRKVKEAFSGDEREWFSPEGLNPHVYAAGNVALDMVADPLNLIPVGLLAKAAKAIPGAKRVGMELASAPNYIKNHYGLTDGPVRPTASEVQMMKALPNSMLDQEKLGLIRKGKGFGEFLKDGTLGAIGTSLSPTGRALYADTGVNQSVQNIVAKHLANPEDPKALAKAAANVNYNQHIVQQAGRKGDIAQSVQTIGERSNLEDYAPNEAGTIAGWMRKNPGTVTKADGTVKSDRLTEADAGFIENHVTNAWGPAGTVVMKRANTGAGGNHFNDLYKKSPFTSVVSAAFQRHKGRPTTRELYDTLKSMEKGQSSVNKFRVKNKDWEDVQKNGLWLTGSIKGSAITEGGVNWLGKVEPSGKLSGIISDKHDFLEKLPVVGKAVEKALPNDLVAVTPPMRASIQSLRGKQFSKLGKAGEQKALYSGVPSPKVAADAPKNPAVLKYFINETPSGETLFNEQLRQAGYISAPIAAGVSPSESD